MARPRKWSSDAERMRAKRAGENGAEVAVQEIVAGLKPQRYTVRHCKACGYPDEAEYVAQMMRLPPLLPANATAVQLEETRARQRGYAHWRWREFHRGEVASL